MFMEILWSDPLTTFFLIINTTAFFILLYFNWYRGTDYYLLGRFSNGHLNGLLNDYMILSIAVLLLSNLLKTIILLESKTFGRIVASASL